jgi:hypothetical protein
VSRIIVSEEFLLWSQMCALWAISSYAIAPDPLPEDCENINFSWRTWKETLPVRIVGTALASYWMTHSIVACGWMTTIVTIHPWIRLRSPLKWTAEIEVLVLISNSVFMLALVRHLHLQSHSFAPASLSTEHFCAILIVGAALLFIIRGGTYIVRGCLRKTGTLPHIAAKSAVQAGQNQIDVMEINRGRLIGNLERLILTIVVAAGSYAALAFLVAAKGLVRSEGLQKRDFAEYFLVGSLSSVLVALCAGVVIRYSLLTLWPELLSLQMQ